MFVHVEGRVLVLPHRHDAVMTENHRINGVARPGFTQIQRLVQMETWNGCSVQRQYRGLDHGPVFQQRLRCLGDTQLFLLHPSSGPPQQGDITAGHSGSDGALKVTLGALRLAS